MSTTTTPRPGGASSGAASAGDAAPTVLVADSLDDAALAGLRAAGMHVEVHPDASPETLPALVATLEPTILVVRSTKVPAEVLTAGRRLGLVIRGGAGYDNIDVATASARGVFVANCPGKNALAVAELTWGLIIGCDRRIPDQVAAIREGTWAKKAFAKHGRGLAGRTLGVLGLGRIGQAVADRGRAFEMDVVAWSRSLTPERAAEAGVEHRATPIDVARDADVLAVCVAATAETADLVNAELLGAMKEGAILVNTARGAVVDEDALADAVRTRGLRAGLDVWKNQPTPSDTEFANPLGAIEGVYGTHHNGASTAQAQEAIAMETVRIARAFVERGEVPNCVNRAASSPARCLLTVRHLNRPGVLAHVFRVLSEAGLNVEEMENVLSDGAQAAVARIRLDEAPDEDRLALVAGHEHVLGADVAAMPAPAAIGA